MAGLTTEEIRFAVWLVAAGFVAGFALSTLWEWLYGRSRRPTVETLISGGDVGHPLTRPAPPPVLPADKCAVLDSERVVRPLQWLDDRTMAGAFEPYDVPAGTVHVAGTSPAGGAMRVGNPMQATGL